VNEKCSEAEYITIVGSTATALNRLSSANSGLTGFILDLKTPAKFIMHCFSKEKNN
jgi:hypothetical protein